MSFAIYQGNDEGRGAVSLDVARWLSILTGHLVFVTYLSGGSQTRRDVRDYYRDIASRTGLTIEETGFSVTLRGPAHLSAELKA